jgi:hypothetical protein
MTALMADHYKGVLPGEIKKAEGWCFCFWLWEVTSSEGRVPFV